MRKISTLFKKDTSNLKYVINEIDPANAWALDCNNSIATQKFDGSACAIIEGRLYKRYDAKKGRPKPNNGIPCQEEDPITGHQPFWVPCENAKPEDRYFIEAFNNLANKEDGTYELCGEKVEGNPERISGHKLLRHGSIILDIPDRSFLKLKDYLADPNNNIEGIVFHHKDGRMCKIRKTDFGFKR